MHVDRGTRIQTDILDLQGRDFRYSGASVVQQHQEKLVPLSGEGSYIRRIQDRLHLLRREVADADTIEPFVRDGQDPLGNWQQ